MVRFPYKRIFDEILPTQYADVLGEIDEKGCFVMVSHLQKFSLINIVICIWCATKTKEAKGKYFYIEMYKADQPTVSHHKQKIYWN